MKNVEQEERREGCLEERTLGPITLSIWFFMHRSSLPALRRLWAYLFIQQNELREIIFTKGYTTGSAPRLKKPQSALSRVISLDTINYFIGTYNFLSYK